MEFNKNNFLKLVFNFLIIFEMQILGSQALTNETSLLDIEENSAIPEALQNLLTEDVAAFEAPMKLIKTYPYYLSGFDDDNLPIWVLEFGKWNIRAAAEESPEALEMLDVYTNQATYRLLNSTKIKSTPENPVEEGILIVDMEAYSLHQLNSIRTVKFVLKKIRQYLPAFEKMHAGYIINTNFLAETVINMARPILGKAMERMEIYGFNREKWIPQLLKKIPKDQLPPWYGGTKDYIPYKVYG